MGRGVSAAGQELQALLQQLPDNPAAVMAELQRRAQDGEMLAQFVLGQACMEGRACQVDSDAGMAWFERAANGGLPLAMNQLGRCHELGQGTAVNLELAAVWYRQAADNGLDWGMYNLANLLATGRGIATDEVAAYALYRRAAESGHAKSMNLVGRCLEDGIGVVADPAAAPDWYRRSAEAGDFRGQASHASLLLAAGRIEDATQWLRKALAHGSPAFLTQIRPQLAALPHPQIRALVTDPPAPMIEINSHLHK